MNVSQHEKAVEALHDEMSLLKVEHSTELDESKRDMKMVLKSVKAEEYRMATEMTKHIADLESQLADAQRARQVSLPYPLSAVVFFCLPCANCICTCYLGHIFTMPTRVPRLARTTECDVFEKLFWNFPRMLRSSDTHHSTCHTNSSVLTRIIE